MCALIITGIVYSYGFLQMSLWTVFHVIALFWGLRFPFHYRKVKLDGYIKYIHIVSVVVAVLAPLIPALPPLKDGFIATGTPPLLCSVRNADYTYYLLILPISILLAVSTSFLVLIFWTVLKVWCILVAGQPQIDTLLSFCNTIYRSWC